MIAIINISPKDAPLIGVNRYRLQINKSVICEFDHNRQVNGLAQCLRDAADAVDAMIEREFSDEELAVLFGVIKK